MTDDLGRSLDRDAHAHRPTPPTPADRLVAYLSREVPEVGPVVEDVEREHGEAEAHRVTGRLADLVLAAYADGDDALGPRVAAALAPGLDEASTMSAWNAVAIGFCEHEGWYDPAVRPRVEAWPGPVGEEMRRQMTHRDVSDTEMGRLAEGWADLWRTAPGQPVDVVESRLRELTPVHPGNPRSELHVVLGARVMSDPRWLLRHPWTGLRLAWRFRDVQSPVRTLRWLLRPRFAG